MELERLILVDLAGNGAIGGERADHRDDHHHSGVGEQRRDLCCAPDVLLTVEGGEPEVGVKAVAQVVAVEDVAGRPDAIRRRSNSIASDDFPDPDSPVIHSVAPRWVALVATDLRRLATR